MKDKNGVTTHDCADSPWTMKGNDWHCDFCNRIVIDGIRMKGYKRI